MSKELDEAERRIYEHPAYKGSSRILLLTKQVDIDDVRPYQKRGTDGVEGGQTLAATAATANPMVPPTRVSLTKCFPALTSDQWPTTASAARGTKAAGAS